MRPTAQGQGPDGPDVDRNRSRGCLIGLAVGDAVGTTAEFGWRGTFPPVTDMVGGGPFDLEPGQWTDDTSMALCLADSLLACGGFDPRDQMARYLRWWEEGYRSSTGECFDIGHTVQSALVRYAETGDPYAGPRDPLTAGNGSIMRLAPVVLFFMPDRERVVHFSGESSRTTHGAPEAVAGAQMLGALLAALLDGASRAEALDAVDVAALPTDRLRSVATGAFRAKEAPEIRGSGYVVESLEAALWCLWRSDSFEEAILRAANLGDDADTTAAICGQLAGARWGESGVPRRWLDRLFLVDEIRDLADALHGAGGSGPRLRDP